MSHLKPLSKCLAMMLVAVTFAEATTAQPKTEQGQGTDAEPICMVPTKGAFAGADQARGGRSKAILVVRKSVPDLEARGFKQSDCEQNSLKTSSDLSNYRDQVCNLAAYGNEAVQAQIYETLGEYPAVLCAHAEKVAGPWHRKMDNVQR